MITLQNYYGIVEDKTIHKLYKAGRKLYESLMIHINSTRQGGGVAEMLQSYIPLMNDIGLRAGWRILHGNPDFFSITKGFHNSLQGDTINLNNFIKETYEKTSENFSTFTHIHHDFVVIHDPQPMPLINYYKKRQPWAWRCHIDLSSPDPSLWAYLKKFILKYDIVIVSHEDYKKEDLPVEQKIIHPAIDPLSYKNMDLTQNDINKTLRNYNIETDKPLMTQISRFDKWKDPEGVLQIFEKVKSKVDCRLILCGSMAADDPEGMQVYEDIRMKAADHIEKGDVILITEENNILVNALQRASNVILQKSTREGFGLTVTEALWKGTPVLASNIGGIPLQIQNGESGFLIEPKDYDSYAEKTVELMKNRKLAEEFGKNGREYVRKNFLITRLIADYMDLMESLQND